MKILEVAKEVEQPNLIGVVETDEKFIHEGQKGSLHLVSPFDKTATRKPRKQVNQVNTALWDRNSERFYVH